MVIISKRAINEFIEQYPKAAGVLLDWYLMCKEADWKNLAELKTTFRSVDFVGNDLYVFNIGGNKYRLIVSAERVEPDPTGTM